jgi:hypothetical protein
MILVALSLTTLLLRQLGTAARFEKGAEVAVSRARQLVHEADKQNRNVRPLPLSIAMV